MNGKEKEFYDILFKNCTEKEIYDILLKKKETSGSRPLWARSKFGLWYTLYRLDVELVERGQLLGMGPTEL